MWKLKLEELCHGVVVEIVADSMSAYVASKLRNLRASRNNNYCAYTVSHRTLSCKSGGSDRQAAIEIVHKQFSPLASWQIVGNIERIEKPALVNNG